MNCPTPIYNHPKKVIYRRETARCDAIAIIQNQAFSAVYAITHDLVT